MRVYRTRHDVHLDNNRGVAFFDCDPPVGGARPVGLPHWGQSSGMAWQTWWVEGPADDVEPHADE